MALVDYLIVAGGAGGGAGGGSGGDSGGGGAGGGVLPNSGGWGTIDLAFGSYTVTVGAGGAAGANGSDSTLQTVGTATGGGKGGNFGGNGSNGGSGGGGGGGSTSGGTGTAGQGFGGGAGHAAAGRGGGGGGASAVGSPGNSSDGGAGGAGVSSSISGSAVTYGSGGGGGGGNGGNGGTNAGNGAASTGPSSGGSGTANRGGGGGGGSFASSSNPAGAGGSGVVIIRYLTGTVSAIGGTITTSGGFTIHTFTSSGTFKIAETFSASLPVALGLAGALAVTAQMSASLPMSIGLSANLPFNADDNRLFMTVDGIMRGTRTTDPERRVLETSLTIEDLLNATPNRCRFSAHGFTPRVGNRVVVALSGIDNPDRLFGGRVVGVDLRNLFDADGRHAICSVLAIDDTWRLNTRKVLARYQSTTLRAVLLALMAEYHPTKSTAGIAADLEDVAIDEITFSNVDFTDALTDACRRGGADWKVNEHGVLRAFVNEPDTDTPDVVDLSSTVSMFASAEDLTQMVTRMIGEFGGGVATTEVPPGETMIPVDNPTWYEDNGGEVISGPQRIAYTGVQAGGSGSVVGPGASPSAAPAGSVAPGAGVETGTHEYAVTFVTAAGESLPGPRRAVTTGTIGAAGSAPTAAVVAGPGPESGVHLYAVTFVNAAGETPPGPTVAVTTGNVAEAFDKPTLISKGPNMSLADLTPTHEYAYAVAYSTNADPTDHSSQTEITTPKQLNVIAQESFEDSTGLRSSQIELEVPYSHYPQARWLHVYRKDLTALGGGGDVTDFRLLQTHANVPGGGERRIIDTVHQSTIAGNHAPSGTNTAVVRTVNLANLAIGPAGTTSRRLYRTTAGGSTLKLLATIANNTATTFADAALDASLGANAPSSNTATNNQVALAAIPIGPGATTARNLYRTIVGDSQLKFLATIANNSATTYLDSTPDGSLTTNAPTADTSGLAQPEGSVIAGSTSLIVAGTGGFSDDGGWAVIGNGEQVIRYSGKTTAALTGIPVSGPGAMVASIGYNSTVTASAAVVGIPASGPGAIAFTIKKGDPVNLFIVVEDLEAQAVLAALLTSEGETSDGVQEDHMSDRRLSATEGRARLLAALEKRSRVHVTVEATLRDRKAKSGRTLTVNLPDPINVAAEFRIQSVRIANFDQHTGPTFTVRASTDALSFEQLLMMTRQGLRAA